MSVGTGAWRERIDDVDAALIDEYQSGFPIRERPFEAVGSELGISAEEALSRVERLHEEGIFRRFGAVLNPPVIGSSTLAAVSVPEDRFDEVAEVINDYQQVNHNYARDHEWNMWFVVTAGSRETRDRIIDEIEDRTGCSVLVLPMLTDYYIDLEFPVVNGDRFARETRPEGESPDERVARDLAGPSDHANGPPAREQTGNPRAQESIENTDASATRISEDAVAELHELDRRLLLAIQEGFPLTATPYRDIAATVDADVADVLEAISRLRENGCIKRIGCVVNHVTTGFDNNCMVGWDVPDDQLDELGQRVGELPYVTLCYHRPRRPEQSWPYNLFTMIHGRNADAVDEKIDELSTA